MTLVLHAPEILVRHDRPGHPENALRLEGLTLPGGLKTIPSRSASDEELLRVHGQAHLQRLAEVCAAGGGQLDSDTYAVKDSEMVARQAAGGVVDLALGVWNGQDSNALAVVRPPGHHALPDRTMGFCFYNHVAVAARALQDAGATRVAILDFDVHHGNGTQDIFYDDGSVFFASSHQFPNWPGTGRPDETGIGAGSGHNLNVTLSPGSGDEDFLPAWRDSILPAVDAFDPDMILVSAGFDSHAADPLAQLEVSTAGHRQVCALIRDQAEKSCDGKVVFCLEGGYHPAAVQECLFQLAEVLLA